MAVQANSTRRRARETTRPAVVLEIPANPSWLNRDRLEALIEQLVAALDRIDGDPDLEPSADYESSLGGPVGDDRELDTADDEHWLGWSIPTDHQNQGAGYTAFCTDFEENETFPASDRPVLVARPFVSGVDA